MANFFIDNEDLLFHLENKDLSEMITLHENDFEESASFDYAPENSVDALDGYKKVLTMIGKLASDFFAFRTA